MTKTRRAGFSKKRRRGGRKTVKRRAGRRRSRGTKRRGGGPDRPVTFRRDNVRVPSPLFRKSHPRSYEEWAYWN